MSKRLLVCGCLWFLQYLFISGQAVAAECSNKLNSNKDFYIDFEIPSANLNEQVIASQANSGTRTQVIWTDNRNASETNAIVEKSFSAGGRYYVRLLYSSDNGKQGALQYFNKTTASGAWQFVSEKVIDLSEIKSADFRVVGNGEVATMECGEGEPPPSPVIPDVCGYFTGPVQSWDPASVANLDWSSQVIGTPDDFHIGFPTIRSPNELKACVTGTGSQDFCIADPSMMVEKPAFVDFIPSGKRISIGSDTVTTLPPGYYQSVTIEGSAVVDLTGGEYWIGELNITASGHVNVSGETVINVIRFNISGAGELNHTDKPSNLLIVAHSDNAEINLSGSGEFHAYVLSENKVTMTGNTVIRGAVTAKELNMSGSPKVIANLSSCTTPNDNYELVISPSTAYGLTCERIPVDFTVLKNGSLDTSFVGNLNVSPSSTSNGEVCWAASENGSCEASSSSIPIHGGAVTLYLQSHLVGDIQVSASVLTPGNQLLTANAGPYRFAPYGFRINSGAAKELIAGKPDALLIEAVASHGAQCEVIEDYGKADGEAKSLRFTGLDYVRPNSGTRPLLINGQAVTEAGNVTVPLTFIKGEVEVPVQYNDAGEISVTLVDDAWQPEDCPAGAPDCDDHQGDWSGLSGTAVLLSRPYTFALCDISEDEVDFSGTSSGGPGFAAAGESFSVTFKPVIWTQDAVMPDQSGDGINDIRTTTSAWCNQLTTPNYYSVSGLVTAPIQLSIPGKPASPTGDGVVAGSLGGTLYHEFTGSEATAGWTIDDLSWSEVGSLWLQADADYLGMPVDQGVGQLGRFYPAHFVIKESAVSDAYGSFTYMNQPFSLSATIEAQNTQNQPTQNYGYFADDYQESLQLRAVNAGATGGDANNLTSRLSEQLSYQQWDKALQTITTDTLALLRVVSSTNPNVTEPDGPYPVDLGLVVESRDDCATRGCSDFSNQPLNVYELDGATPETAAALAGDIHARYGRMRLEDAVGREGEKINIPVLLEYWEAGQFVTHSDDHDSVFNGQRYFKQGITNPSTSAITASVGDIKVHAGRSASGDLYATEGVSSEQVRFWQKLVADPPAAIAGENPVTDSASGTHAGSESQPWLLYNWRGQGDENPSALVTFGVYRGNDRVIYRGERNIPVTINR
ncbi:DUF6701 domain-containing protein [Photobacterium halotolerans]|uniref:DUF6701 domain-containing protein n=1 Tax=Photobacterium halotolerans TaxID=265726 RepID=A0A0F5VDT6_9GAMM|nr:DUF6701 domain-containing protein [Photobacterium halotolerans]KKC99966.1 hypothetical protein KY46_10605 [Photobacterium halotolerans]